MYPNPQTLPQFYPSQSRTTYPYPFYFQQNHAMNFPSPTSTQKATPNAVAYDEIFTNAPPMPSLPTTQARFQGEQVVFLNYLNNLKKFDVFVKYIIIIYQCRLGYLIGP